MHKFVLLLLTKDLRRAIMMQIRAWLQIGLLEKGKRSHVGCKMLLICAVALVLYGFYICGGVHNPSLRSHHAADHLHLVGSGRPCVKTPHNKPGTRSHDPIVIEPGNSAASSTRLKDKSSRLQGIEPFTSDRSPELGSPARQQEGHGQCNGRFVYIYNLPSEFNEDLVDKCGRVTDTWVPLCGDLNNHGYGPLVPSTTKALHDASDDSLVDLVPLHAWYRTEQFSLELIFHERLRRGYPCLTQDPELASAFYIPYYAALDTAFTLFNPNLSARDRLAQRLIGWLSGNAVWAKFQGGKKHFMVLGRVAWDFSRDEDVVEGWGSALLSQRELSNVTKLLIEKRTWVSNEIAIPYPTSFHPSSLQDMQLWQEKLRGRIGKRGQVLCSFIGSTSRGPEWSRSLRLELAKQCDGAGTGMCREYKCGDGNSGTLDCTRNLEHVSTVFLSSTFCLQPSGDSPTRKGIFDSLLTGCIPVLFASASAYTQYMWHLPQNGSLYSVFFDGDKVIHGHVDIFATLLRIADDTERLHRMQEEIIRLLPHIVYSLPDNHHSNDLTTFRDAFDVALENFLEGPSIPTS